MKYEIKTCCESLEYSTLTGILGISGLKEQRAYIKRYDKEVLYINFCPWCGKKIKILKKAEKSSKRR